LLEEVDMQQNDPLLYFACPFLGGMVGSLIVLPVALQTQSMYGPIMLIAGFLAGGLLGYRRRDSRAFLYVSLFATVTLLTLILFQM
jgi:hypothetical protein